LSVSQGIIEQHGGSIQVESTLGAGSCFTVSLPADATRHGLEATPKLSSQPVLANPYGQRASVLVVDDEEFVRQFMQEALRTCFNCRVEGVADGVEASEKLRQGSYDLVISDIRMPRMDGLQLRDWIAGNRPDLMDKLVFVTGHAGLNFDQQLGAMNVPVIRKPFTLDAIVAICRPILHRTGHVEGPQTFS
jgi:CheY-like chemotaxis protein